MVLSGINYMQCTCKCVIPINSHLLQFSLAKEKGLSVHLFTKGLIFVQEILCLYLIMLKLHLPCILLFFLFSDFMNSSVIKDPPELRRKFDLFTAEQRTLNKKRLDLLESLRFAISNDKIILVKEYFTLSYTMYRRFCLCFLPILYIFSGKYM